jgi:hypothetical protein
VEFAAHATIGAEVIARIPRLERVAQVILSEQELRRHRLAAR